MLTDVEARKAVKKDKPYKLYDAGVLFLVVTKTGVKLWRMRYVRDGNEKLLSFGPYPSAKAQNQTAFADHGDFAPKFVTPLL